ncbi:MAG: CRISPR-associated endonuclease Cas2 [Clostridia bacterium]|nr:CRISPR-associated endonuclease Cas2 [Clostridia bacterium]
MSKFMRIIVFFDLPVVTKKDRKIYAKFRHFLINDGYIMLQFSVYSRICNGDDGVYKHYARLKENLPKKGSIRCMKVTEKQYASMEILVGKKTVRERKTDANQLSIF